MLTSTIFYLTIEYTSCQQSKQYLSNKGFAFPHNFLLHLSCSSLSLFVSKIRFKFILSSFIPPPGHPITAGITVIVYHRRSCSSKHNCWYFLIFSSRLTSLLDSFGRAISTDNIFSFTVSSNERSGLLTMQFVLILYSQSQDSLVPLFSIAFALSHLAAYHFVSLGSSPFSIGHFTASTFRALSWCLTYSAPASSLHQESRCWTVSLCSQHKRHLSSSTNRLIFFRALVLVTQISMKFFWGLCYISSIRGRLRHIAFASHFEAPSLEAFVVYFFLPLIQDLFQLFPYYFPFCIYFFSDCYAVFIKGYHCIYVPRRFFSFSLYLCLFFSYFISPCCHDPLICWCSHAACHAGFRFVIRLP